MSNPTPTLEQKIAAALTAADVTSSDLSQLIAETEAAITTADATAEEERERALDPVKSPDPKQARQTMEEAIFARDRLRTLLPRLQQRHPGDSGEGIRRALARRLRSGRGQAQRAGGGAAYLSHHGGSSSIFSAAFR